MAGRLNWLCCVLVALTLLDCIQSQESNATAEVQSQESNDTATTCASALECLIGTVIHGDGLLSSIQGITDDSPTTKEAHCAEITSPEGFESHLNACVPEDINCTSEEALAWVKARRAEIQMKYAALFNYSCSGSDIYLHADPCVAASYCLGNASKYYEEDLVVLEAKSPDELKETCERNDPMSGGVQLQKCARIVEFCQDDATKTTLLGQYASIPLAFEQARARKCMKNSATGECGLKFSACLIHLIKAFHGKAEFDVPGGMLENQAEFCRVVAVYNMTATLTDLAQCSADALMSDACGAAAGASEEERNGLAMFSEIHALCSEQCEGIVLKMSQMEECLPEAIRDVDHRDRKERRERREKREEKVEDDPKKVGNDQKKVEDDSKKVEDDSKKVEDDPKKVDEAALCDILAGNQTIVACVEQVTNCCPLTTLLIQSGFQKQVRRLGLESRACLVARITVNDICMGGTNQEYRDVSGAAQTTASLLASLLAASHALL